MEGDPRQNTGRQAPESLRDWQRQDTWYGPYPGSENPFDEPEDAPELRELRSEELNNRSGDFWQTQTSGYRFGSESSATRKAEPARKAEKPRVRIRKRGWILGGTAAVLILGLFLFFVVFTVQNVRVAGNRQIPAGEIIRLSGIQTGTPLFGLREEEIERGLARDPALKFRYLEKEPPGTVILHVQEREACCWMTWNGIFYTMDRQRVVLYESEVLPPSLLGDETEDEESEATSEKQKKQKEEQERVARLMEQLVRADGLNIRSGVLPGQTLVLEDAEQQAVFNMLFLEMKVLACTDQIQEADLSNLDSLLLTTRDGFTVAMGDSRNIHAKLRSMLLTREELLRQGYAGGVINVTLPETPVFSPADS